MPPYKHKGEKTDPNNYRRITILSCFGKLFPAVLNDRLSKHLDNTDGIGEEQAGFRKGFSILDHIFTMRSLLDLYLKKRENDCIAVL